MPMKRLPLVVLAGLGLSVAACGGGGGGGNETAFCDALEVLSDQVADGDLASDRGLDDVNDTVNDLIESADDGEQLDAVNTVADDVEVAAPGDADDVTETIQDELGGFAEDCDIDEDEFAIAPETTTTTVADDGGDTTDTTADDGGDTTDTTESDGGGGAVPDDIVVHDRQPVPGGVADPALAQSCFDGDMGACDQLATAGDVYGDTCGGRLDDRTDVNTFLCADVITGPIEVPPDVADQATAGACRDGDMVACDDLFNAAADGSIDRVYGALCAGRVPDTDAFCVDIFGDVALV